MSAALNCNISFIGGGNMAQALIGGLISQGCQQRVLQFLIRLRSTLTSCRKRSECHR